MKTLNKACLFSAALLFLAADAFALAYFPSSDTLSLSIQRPANYENYAQRGTYVNPSWVGEVPEWNYYDIFGNHIVEGFYLFDMSMNGNSNREQSDIALSPILKKWLNGMVQVGDMADNRGIMVLAGDRVATHFTPFTFNQSLFCGARIDVFFDLLYGMNSLTFINSRISNTGIYGMYMENYDIEPSSDWLHGVHLNKNIKDIFNIGGTLIDMRNQVNGKPGSLAGSYDSLFPNSASALQIYGLNGSCNLPTLKAYGEWAQSQEVVDGSFRPKPGNAGAVNFLWNVLEPLKLGGEGYIVESRYKTTYYDPACSTGDLASQKYLYQLVEDNDDKDQFPENGQEGKINFLPYGGGDWDGVMPVKYDKNKNGIYDWEEDFLNYDCDPPKSDVYYDRNNNGVPDEIEDDAYPDYPYVPSYYRSGERYLKQNDRTGKWIDTVVKDSADIPFNMERQVSKGLSGFHLYGQYDLLPKLSLTLGGMAEQSEERSFQMKYQNGTPIGYDYLPEKSMDLYTLLWYQHDFTEEKKLTLKNYLRYVQDNIPNHWLTSTVGYNLILHTDAVNYTTNVDQLDYRDALVEMLVAQYDIYRNRGFNFTTRGKWEFTKHFPHLDFNYPEENISSLTLVNKCEYIWALPFLKDMFLTPKYKNIYEWDDYGPRGDVRMDSLYHNNTMSNNAYLVYDWKFTPKTSLSTGIQFELFNDFFDPLQNYYHGNWTLQLMIKDRYAGLNMIVTTGVSLYNYVFYNSQGMVHHPFNNPTEPDPYSNPYGGNSITDNIQSYYLFLKIHCGF
ncbi:MAG TPA: hypothetical protein VLX68_10685 [Chitinivibrionales bacterium]|nr:hypothetical protein [Chitinivibrionales bacterium]